MDLSFSPEEEAFRIEVRSWLHSAMPPHIREKAECGAHFDHDEMMAWHRIVYERGWAAPHWPVEHGGAGFDAARQFIFAEEVALSGAPHLSPFALYMVGPLLLNFGNAEQKARFLPPILRGDEAWCQGYSEPNSGSDLASLQMRAEIKGDHFVVNGQKTWTTYAQYADWIFCLVRTSTEGRKQEGISFLLIDMKSPGVRAVPMLTTSGVPAFCDTYFDDVEVPYENLLGPLHGGWMLAKALLGHERTLVGAMGPIRRSLRKAKRIASTTLGSEGEPLIDDPIWRQRIARIEMRVMAHQMVNYRALAKQAAGHMPGPESSILKLVGSTLQQQLDTLMMDLMGPDSLSWFNDRLVPPEQAWVPQTYCYNRATTIYAGSNEIQKNIIAKLILGLPRS